ncbi:hypothetical protein C2845_PM14G13400 [Panicum miliaceum]|uniref:Peptidase A1 domain-containing protein n=1 Tax=Panicum miliaceum TaxID=4540 RepID=A0A3L6PTF8_PANMI|nr:hypothetical protein C2845_PM14G13400 [Panicum miliaceum]
MSAQVKPTPTATMIYLFPRVISLLALPLLPCVVVASGSEQPPYRPLVSPLAKDRNTSLYTISIKKSAPLVVDLAGSLVWSTCPSTHGTVPCHSGTSRAANQQRRPRCRYVDAGGFGANREPGGGCACAGRPFNPVTGECSVGDLTGMAMSANATDGRNTLHPVEFTTAGSCAPDRLLRSLPAGATGVAGFSRRPLSLPSQLSSQREFGNKFALCLPDFALFGNSSVNLGLQFLPDLTSVIPHTPLVRNPRNGAHYLPVKSISVLWDQAVEVSLPAGALDLDASTGRGGVVLSTVTPYMAMRPDVYRSFLQAYDAAVRGKSYVVERVAAVAPFELCYNAGALRPQKRFGRDVPTISLELAGSPRPWTVPNANYMVFVDGWVACVGVVEMGRGAAPPVEDEPAVVLGGMQLENRLLVFDLDKGVLGFSDLIWYMETSCSDFNFTRAS